MLERPEIVPVLDGELSLLEIRLAQDVYSGEDVAAAAGRACEAIDALN